MNDAPKIPPKSEWLNMSATQLFEVKSQMTNMYYNMRGINASFSAQYQKFIFELDALISLREKERLDAELAAQE